MTHYRLGKSTDVPHIAVMSRDLIEYGLGWSWTAERVQRYLRHPESTVVVAQTHDRMTGFAIMEFHEEHAHLNLLAVRPVHQRQGIGKGLIEWLEGSARVAGVTSVLVEVRTRNVGGRKFYRRLGYREIAYLPGYYAQRESGIRMLRDLSWPVSEPAPERS